MRATRWPGHAHRSSRPGWRRRRSSWPRACAMACSSGPGRTGSTWRRAGPSRPDEAVRPARTCTEGERLDVAQPLPELLTAAKVRSQAVAADRDDLDGAELAESHRVAIVALLLQVAFQPQRQPIR